MKNTSRHNKLTIMRLTICLMLLLACGVMSAQTRRALLVGISDYPKAVAEAWPAIHGANDVELIAPVLQKQGFRITKICNKAATANKIRKEMASLAAACKNGDMVYIHFSCHGQPFEDKNGDEEDGWDESIIPYDAQTAYSKGKYEGANHIIDDELHGFFQKLRKAVGEKGFVCVVVDACHAGGASRGDDDMEEDEDNTFVRGTKKGFSPLGKEYRPRINAKGHFRIAKEKGLANIVILEACRSYQTNYEIRPAGKYHGPLSYYVSQVLSRKKLSCDIGWVHEVRDMMAHDGKLTRQNMVYETTLE